MKKPLDGSPGVHGEATEGIKGLGVLEIGWATPAQLGRQSEVAVAASL